jgi:Flp pilus assembly pilin Flp
METQTGEKATPVRARRRLTGDERGQGLVEYALIIAVVSLGAVLALGFLSGKINGIFSKAGNKVDNVAVGADNGSGGGGGGGGGSAPATPTITGGPAEGSSGNTAAFTSPSFTFTGDGTQTGFECSLDAAAFASCASPKGYSGLGTGAHQFQVRATNGNGPSSPATRNWTISAQTFAGNSNGTTVYPNNSSDQLYGSATGAANMSQTTTNGQFTITAATTLSNFSVTLGSACTSGGDSCSATLTITVMKNGSPTGITCSIPAGSTTCSDTTHTAAFAVNDKLNIRTSRNTGGPDNTHTGSWTVNHT